MLEHSRRETLIWLARATGVAVFAPALDAYGAGAAPPPSGQVAQGYGRDPPLLKPVVPWPLTLSEAQMKTAARLVDLLLPADARSPAASALGVHRFVDEWISAPYPTQRADRGRVLALLEWLDREAGGVFARATEERLTPVLDRVCDETSAVPADKATASAFDRLRQIALAGYFTHQKGMADLGYTPATGSTEFAGPPRAVLDHLGLS